MCIELKWMSPLACPRLGIYVTMENNINPVEGNGNYVLMLGVGVCVGLFIARYLSKVILQILTVFHSKHSVLMSKE